MSRILKCHDVYLEGVASAKGCLLKCLNGKEYIDYESGSWCAALGHGHPRVNRVISQQTGLAVHLNNRYLGEVSERAAKALLARLAMPEGKCLFLSSGSEAVEFGVQAMRMVSKKPLLVTFRGSYLSAYGSSGAKTQGEWALVDWEPCRNCPGEAACDENCPALEQVPFERVGGFVLEPGSSYGKVIFPPAKVVSGLARIVRARGGLVMANEITTGMGRTGKWFGHEHYGLKPDVAAVGKILGNGYPVSASALGPGLGERLLAGGIFYAQSHQNDPLGCAVALKVISVLHQDGLVGRAARVGAWFKSRLERMAEGREYIREVRGRGLMLAVELAPGLARVLHQKLLEMGYLVGLQADGNLIRFHPAFTMEQEHFLTVLDAMEDVLNRMNPPGLFMPRRPVD